METIADRIKKALEMNNMKQSDLVEKTGIGKSSISTYLSGAYEPKQKNIYRIAKALDVNEAWLMGHDVPPDRKIVESNILPFNLSPLPKMKRVPVLGKIACGVPILAEQNFDGYVNVPESVEADFSLQCQGDSMINARILDGDMVFIRQQPDVENGEIAAVLIDNEATLKRVYKQSGKLTLMPENSSYPPFTYSGSELENIRILGKAVAFLSAIR